MFPSYPVKRGGGGLVPRKEEKRKENNQSKVRYLVVHRPPRRFSREMAETDRAATSIDGDSSPPRVETDG